MSGVCLPWDDYFMAFTQLSPTAQDKAGKAMGACIVSGDKVIVGIAYREKVSGGLHLPKKAILNKNCIELKGCTLYVQNFPCNECTKLIIQSRIASIKYMCDTDSDMVEVKAAKRMFDAAGVSYQQYVPQTNPIIVDFKAIDYFRH